MIFMPRALSVTSIRWCTSCLFDILEILEMAPGIRGGIGIRCRLVRMCGCGVEGREKEEACKVQE